MPIVGMIEVVVAHRVRVQLEAGEAPSTPARPIARNHFFGRSTEGKRKVTTSIMPARLAGTLLEEELAVDTPG